jgi:hypothetical protein
MTARIEIPDEFMGVPVNRKTVRETLKGKNGGSPLRTRQKPNTGFPKLVSDNPHNYIQVPQYNGLVIAIAESHKGKNMYETLEVLEAEDMRMPFVGQFMSHWLNVRNASVDNRELFYADGTPVGKAEKDDLWSYLSSEHNGGCWTMLNNLFVKENNSWYMETDLGVVMNGVDKVLKGKVRKSRMDDFLDKDGYVNLDLNSQGFPVSASANQRYEQGRNFYFYSPVEGAVAGFGAGSDWAVLYCCGYPDSRDASLGVFACAEGATP